MGLKGLGAPCFSGLLGESDMSSSELRIVTDSETNIYIPWNHHGSRKGKCSF